MKPSTMTLFEQEMHDQVSAAHDAVLEAERRGDPLLLQAAQAHLESLADLARRNGVSIDPVIVDRVIADAAAPLAAPAV
jgi:hypothetical protein